MELIKQIGADEFKIDGYKFISFNKKGAETTAYYVNDNNFRQGIGLSIFTAGYNTYVNVTAYNLFYEKDSQFEEAVSKEGKLVEEERQACLSLLKLTHKHMPRGYMIHYTANVEHYILGGRY